MYVGSGSNSETYDDKLSDSRKKCKQQNSDDKPQSRRHKDKKRDATPYDLNTQNA